MIADPLHRADCCVVTDSGGALIVVHPDIAKTLKKPVITMMGAGETTKGQMGGKVDLTYSGLAWAAPRGICRGEVDTRTNSLCFHLR
jgi:acetyl-CoA C-acetyltransferase